MIIDEDYLKKMLSGFQAAKSPVTDILELAEHGLERGEPEFEFHLRILADSGFVARDGKGGLGVARSGDGIVHWSVVPLRLTADGHDFAKMLGDKEVAGKMTSIIQDAGLRIAFETGKVLLSESVKTLISGG